MRFTHLKTPFIFLIPSLLSLKSVGHGLVESPPSRNQFCGVITKPPEIGTSTAEYPACAPAFATDPTGAYSFMAVLTHTRGRLRPLPPLSADETPPGNEASGTPSLPENVCGFNAETFGSGATLWDEAIDWPTNSLSAGRQKFTWNISWGPHIADTQEFHYWITKPNFNFRVGEKLNWDDFEDQPFCKLNFDTQNYDANPDIVARVNDGKFDTFCDVPERNGRHVIYAEWGRNYFTWERFHGCIDVVFNGGEKIEAQILQTPNIDLIGASSVTLDGTGSTGNNLNYSWRIVDQTTDATYTFANPTASITTLQSSTLSNPGSVTVALTVSNGESESLQTRTINHSPSNLSSSWIFQKPLTSAKPLNIGDTIQLRVVTNTGQDIYIPETPFTITDNNAAANLWPQAFARVINQQSNDIAIGILGNNNRVAPTQSATSNNIYLSPTANIASVFLNIEEKPVETRCTYEIIREWSNGFLGRVVINNLGNEAINGWSVSWRYNDGTKIQQIWNANYSGSYTASNLSWNGLIQPGGTVEFGFNGVKSGPTTETPALNGPTCN